MKSISPWSVFVVGALLMTAVMNTALFYFSGIDKPLNVRENHQVNE